MIGISRLLGVNGKENAIHPIEEKWRYSNNAFPVNSMVESLGGWLLNASKKMSRLTISDAQKFYRSHHGELIADYKSLIRLIRDAKIRHPLSNSNYLHALSFTGLMMDETSYQFRMLTGGALDGFLDTLRSNFEKMLERIRSNKATHKNCYARVLIVNGETSKGVADLLSSYSDVLDLSNCRAEPGTEKDFRHFIVSDSDMLRDEQYHEPLSDSSDASDVVADVHFFDPSRAKMFANRFDTFWTAVKAS